MDFTFPQFELNNFAQTLISIVALALAAAAANLVVKQVLLRLIWRYLERVAFDDDLPSLPRVAQRLATIIPTLVVERGIRLVPHLSPEIDTVVGNICSAIVVLCIAMALSAGLSVVNELYRRRPEARSRPIKGYVQVIKILVYLGAAILMVAALMEQSPLLLLSGLGAMAAVLMLVFKDTILSLVASVQLASNDMLRVGDWIEMPQLNADGDVIDIALHTVKVQNWDHTITTIPTHRLISESFRNWRGMQDSGGRRIQRALSVDQNCVGYLTGAQMDKLEALGAMRPYLQARRREIDHWNRDRDASEQRRLTNIGTYRAYVEGYLRAHPLVAQDMLRLVRQRDPTPEGLPLEIYCFVARTGFVEFEAVQADIFDHLIAMLPEFGLRLFQHPAGSDFARALGRLE
ncbi:mechanosensitive ion channel family protein [Stakelama sp. CBK3Z-3]|uniref:Mechanosensitive ion channel family protein n=1 Tax=Stakelama flava TaxID=2860338 RepID=A0ABS6XMA7_9SPHN|nr:mechanosensitive ion channel family protein [Stakelama flava]MBW4330526.1 mechanosensitive ion channel family protein [Stakelama flava]